MSDKNGGIKTKPLDNIDTLENITDNDNDDNSSPKKSD